MLALNGCAWFRKKPVQSTAPVSQPPTPAPTRRRSTTTRRSAPSKPQTTSTQPPMLGEMLNKEQQAEYSRAVDAAISRAMTNVATAKIRRLSEAELGSVARVELFVRQAQDAKSRHDLVGARSLAERADLLSSELVQ
jgi:hypothetical protein